MAFFRSQEWKVLWPFYLEAFLGTILYVLPPFIVLYFKEIGFSASGIGLLMSVWPLAALVSELPTGAIADLWGRKLSVISGYALEGVFAFLLFFFTNNTMVFLLFFLIGVSKTLTSGAKEAWVVDLLTAKDLDHLRSVYFSKYFSFFNLAFVLSGLAGAFFVDLFDLRIIWLITSLSYFMSAVFLFFGEEEFVPLKTSFSGALGGIWRQTKETALFVVQKRTVSYVYLISVLFAMAGVFRSMLSWTPFLNGFGFPEANFGYLWTGMNIFGVIAPLIAVRVLRYITDRSLLIWLSVITLIYGVVILSTNSLFMLIGMILVSAFIFDFRMPVARGFFHRFIPTHIRSTSGSFEQLLNSAVRLLCLPLVGILVDTVGAKRTVFISTLFMAPAILLYIKIGKPSHERAES
ncbi:MAG: MFS transporter [Verrucomicrobiota bacterium]